MFLRVLLVGVISLFYSTANTTVSAPQQQQSIEEKFKTMPPMRIVQVIEGTKTRAFSKDSLIYGGLDDDDLKPWRLTLQKTQACAREETGNESPFTQHFNDITSASELVIGIIKKQHTSLKPMFREKNATDKEITTESGKIFDAKLIEEENAHNIADELENDILHLQRTVKKLRTAYRLALYNITTNLPIPSSWKNELYVNKKIKNANTILHDYKKILSQYNTARKQKKLDNFLEQYKLNQEKDAMPFVGNLERIIFIMQEKEKLAKPSTFQKIKKGLGFDASSSRATRIEDAEELLDTLMQKHPDILSDLSIRKIYETNDKPATILFAQAFNLLCVCRATIKELEKIREKIVLTHPIDEKTSN